MDIYGLAAAHLICSDHKHGNFDNAHTCTEQVATDRESPSSPEREAFTTRLRRLVSTMFRATLAATAPAP